MESCILYRNLASTLVIVDIPRSLELAQGFSANSLRLKSCPPLQQPFPSVEPKSAKSKAKLEPHSLGDLLLQKHLEFALLEVRSEYKGPWYLPRVTKDAPVNRACTVGKGKRWSSCLHREEKLLVNGETASARIQAALNPPSFHHNPQTTTQNLTLNHKQSSIPPLSTSLLGTIQATVPIFTASAPSFNIILLDPPWPNRSARRKGSYHISYGESDINSLLSLLLPVSVHLADNGLLAIWVTNKPAFVENVIGKGGLFEEWGVDLIEQWVWLKITADGEPISPLDGLWRKPYEILLIGRKMQRGKKENIKRRIVVGVPDLHSRKPNLKAMFEVVFGLSKSDYHGLEIFARNLTAGWWSWGDECFLFQGNEHWVDDEKDDIEGEREALS